ncbi:unnamed protein product [Microthlaspi erraticum]|uniref:DUF295 domain-containing protein n=1 Tax=Microthlaspi erraticum TaxID=1685480 RepID=A0A6D2IV18_9BRAS|nr:unnamed protein product [Microthlaspi erraticum]
MLDCQILSLGYEYRMFGGNLKDYICMAVLPLNKEGEILVIDPYSLDVTLTIPSSLPLEIVNCLVPSGNDELFLVKETVFFIMGFLGNLSCSGKELPDGCGVPGNSIVITDEPGRVTYLYKYGVDTGNAEDDLSFWRSPRDTCVRTISRSPMYYHFRVEQNLSLEA